MYVYMKLSLSWGHRSNAVELPTTQPLVNDGRVPTCVLRISAGLMTFVVGVEYERSLEEL